MKVSVITTIRNCGEFLESNIDSVHSQSYSNIEHIIIDAYSNDATVAIVDANKSKIAHYVSEKDRGIYDGINKGLRLAAGDVIAMLNGDDVYADENVINDVVNAFENSGTDAVYGDIVYVNKIDTNKVIRYWRAGEGDRAKIANGWMPPHPALFIKKEVYDKYGYFNSNFYISADYEIILRFLYMHRISISYMHRLCVKMRIGGISNRNIFRILQKTCEDYKACKTYGIDKAAYAVMLKNLRKLSQFFKK